MILSREGQVSTPQRYHIHVCLVRNEHPEFENALQLALSDGYFLTWDLIAHPSQFMDYTRQQIDQCDYLLFVLGNGYGHLSPSGVSLLHLSYIYAVTKKKPLLALIKTQTPQVEFSRQRIDLASLIDKDQGNRAMYFLRTQQAIDELKLALNDLINTESTQGWVRGTIAQPFSRNILQPKPATTTTLRGNLLSSVPNPSKNFDPPPNFENMTLDDSFLVNFSAHAYQAGNLQEVMATHSFTWREVIDQLRLLTPNFSSDSLLRRLNESLKPVALMEASKVVPNLHAVSRHQINNVDFQWLKQQLVDNQWLLPAKDERIGREFWRLNTNLTN
ncbi:MULTISPECIES: DUF4062 domain-containing protein [unclassified Moraxella]|uniref:DUF4062 domain-containing protein n=1 Tax=unclassified Moraxella TaxID=2685852 RepID=UPI003AF8F224